MDLNERICRYLAACPPAISGSSGHNTTFTVACALVNGFGLTEAQAVDYLSLYNARCQPQWSESELLHKVQSAANAQHSKARGHLVGNNGFSGDDFRNTSFPARKHQPVTQPIDPSTAIENFLKRRRASEADLWDASKIQPPDDLELHGICLLQHLYHAGEIINTVTDFEIQKAKDETEKAVPVGYGTSVERSELIDLWSLGMPKSKAGGWMRMNPTDGQGIADKNITHFRFVLLEFDNIPLDLQISLFAYLPLPIAAILTSGGKSVHAWVKVESNDLTGYKDDASMLLKMLLCFGLDDKNKNPSRLSRLVGVTRQIGNSEDGRQRLIYLNPSPTQSRIMP